MITLKTRNFIKPYNYTFEWGLSMYDVAALGELLIDFTPAGVSESGMRLFEQNPGGAPANVLCALSNLGMKTAFLGKVGKDMHGDFLRSVLNDKGVNTSGLIEDDNVFTTLAFVALSDTGERSFSFARKPGADTCLRPDELNEDVLKSCRVFHFGSLSLTNEPSRSATIKAAQIAKDAGAIISYDPNYRAPLWSSEKEAETQMRKVLPLVDIIKISEEETALITGNSDPKQAAYHLLDQGVGCAVITLGKAGAMAATKHAHESADTFIVPVVDTTGAGDAFWGGFLHRLVLDTRKPSELMREHLKDYLLFANAVAALCVQKRGAIPSMPTKEEVKKLIMS